jgi:hypothetical protein
MSAVTKIVKGAGDVLFGGGKTDRGAYGNMSQQEIDRMNGIEGNLKDLFNTQTQEGSGYQTDTNNIEQLFRDHLTQFLTNNGNPSPEQTAAATNFVDKTFTAPTQNALDQYMGNFESEQNAKAASLGRNPNSDVATNQAIFGEGYRQTKNLQNERASRIASRADDQGLQTLNAGLTGSNFLNSLTQQSFSNRLGLLNARSGIADYYQKNRGVLNQQGSGSAGLLPTLGSLGPNTNGAISGVTSAVKGIGGLF